VRLLFDQNLSDRLLRVLDDDYPGSVHVRHVGLERADDEDVWRYAFDRGLVITSKDSDFHQRSLVRGHPPKVVWIRTGNCTTDRIAELLRLHREDLLTFDGDPEASFLILS
jgi:predicted nuclease of predicted toxin-antitoxin system